MRWSSFLISLLFLLPFFVELQVSGVWDSNEAFYIQTPREMAERGDWLVPYFNGKPRLNKPPLCYWLVWGLQSFTTDPIAAERWALVLVATGNLLCCYLLGRLLTESSTGGLLALGISATCFRFLILSRRLLIDTLLLFCLLAALTAFVYWLATRQKLPFLLAGFFLALGFLTKGPVVGVAVFIVLVYLWITRQLATLWKAPWGWFLLILIVVCVPWYLLLARRLGFDVLLDFFLLENLGRFTHLDFGPSRGPFYYVGVFLADFSPWSFLVLGSLPWWWVRLRDEWSQRRSGWEGVSGIPASGVLMACWILIWIGLFSLSRNKQEYYILPVYPVAACWLANWLKSGAAGRIWNWLSGVPVALATIVLALLGIGFLGLSPAIWLLLAFPVAFWVSAVSGRWLWAAVSLSLFFSTSAFLFTMPLERFRPVRHFAAQIEKQAAPEARVGYYRLASPSLTVYLNRPIEEIYTAEEARRLFAQTGEIWLLVEDREFSTLQGLTSDSLQVIDRRPLLRTRLADILDRLRGDGSSERFAFLIRRSDRTGG